MNAVKSANYTKVKVRELQRTLYLAAKANTKRRFHALYDKVYRSDVMWEAWKRVKANRGSAGIDGVTIQYIVREYGKAQFVRDTQRAANERRCIVPSQFEGKISRKETAKRVR